MNWVIFYRVLEIPAQCGHRCRGFKNGVVEAKTNDLILKDGLILYYLIGEI